MASGSFTGSTSNTYITPRISWSSTANNTTNKSELTVRFQLKKSSSSTSSTYGTGSWKLTIGGTTYDFSKVITIQTNNTYMTVYSKTVTITHDDDGGKTVAIQVTGGMPDTTYTSTSLSKTITLDTIPRSSSFTVPSSVNTGSNFTISIAPSSSAFRHRFRFEIDGTAKHVSDYVAAGTKSFSYTIPHSWLPKVTSQKITVYCYTYPASGDSYIARVKKTLTANVPSSIKPTVSAVTKALINGLDSKYVQGKSQVELTATASPGNGSTVVSYIFKGANISGTSTSYTGTSKTKLSSIIQSSGTLTYQVAAKDARGRTSDYKSVSINVYAYAPPQIKLVSADRCQQNGTLDTNGTYAKVTVKISYSSIGGSNKRVVKLYNSKDNYATGTEVISASSTSTQYIGVYGSGFSTSQTYTIKAVITDTYNTESNIYKTAELDTAIRTLNISKYGNGVAIGGMSTATNNKAQGLFECSWPTELRDTLSVSKNLYLGADIGCSESYSGSNFAMFCQWKDGENHDILVRSNDGLTMGLGWIGSDTYPTVLDVRPKTVNMRGALTAPRCTLTSTSDASPTAQNVVPLRIGKASEEHMDIDSNEIIAKDSPTTLGSLSFGGSTIGMYVNEVSTFLASKDDTSEFIRSVPTYNRTYDASPNVYITSAGTFGRSTSSSQRYKIDIDDIQDNELNPYNILNIPVRQYKYNEENIPVGKNADDLYIGLIAEEVEKAYPVAAEYNEDGQVEMWNIKAIVPAMLKILQDQQKEIEQLKEQLNNIN